MADDKDRAKSLSDKQVLSAIRTLLGEGRGGATTGASSPGSIASVSDVIADIIGEVVIHVIGEIPDIVAEIVTDGIPDVADIADVIGDIVLDVSKEVVVHLIVDVILDLALRPIDPSALASGDFGEVIKERVRRAKRVVDATVPQRAPSSRELATLRQILLKRKGRK